MLGLVGMKITAQQQAGLDAFASIIENHRYPFGEKCPLCGRPHVFEYSDGTNVCDKCGYVVIDGSAIKVKEWTVEIITAGNVLNKIYLPAILVQKVDSSTVVADFVVWKLPEIPEMSFGRVYEA
jgi:ribosomal protein L37AE/L43A